MNVTINLPEFEGFEYTGEYRIPRKGDYWVNGKKPMNLRGPAVGGLSDNRFILREKKTPTDRLIEQVENLLQDVKDGKATVIFPEVPEASFASPGQIVHQISFKVVTNYKG